jgi:hypothetical protein
MPRAKHEEHVEKGLPLLLWLFGALKVEHKNFFHQAATVSAFKRSAW